MKILITTIRFVLEVLPKKQKIKLIGVAFLLLLNSLLELLGLGAILPVFSVLLEDNVVEKYAWAQWIYTTFGLTDEKQLIIALAVGLFVIIVLKNILSLFIAKANSTFALSLFKNFAVRLHKFYYKQGFTFFKSTNSNVIVRNLRSATNDFAFFQILGSLNLLNEIIVLLFIVIFIAFYNLQILGLLLITVVPPFYLFYRWVRQRSIELGNKKNEIEPIIGKNLFQSIYGYTDTVITGSEKNFRINIKKNLNDLVEIDIKTTIYNLAPTRVIETSLMLAIAVMIGFGIYILPSKTDLLKMLGLFAVAGYRIMPSINRMMIAINGLNRSKWIFDILAPLKNKDTIEKKGKDQNLNFRESLELKKISFAYQNGGDNIFKEYSLKINKGEVIGLVGPSGAGKTTLMNILLGFLKPHEGTYEIDGIPLNNSHLISFYRKIGYVQQQVYLIDGTVAENVAFGSTPSEIDHQKLQKVLKRASLWETVKKLPEGVNEMLGENGTKLSGGQRQRIGIARALYFGAEILFFDEATSSLDTETENEITEAINDLSDGKLTLIIIAHRTSTLKNCNRIIEVNRFENSKNYNLQTKFN